MDYILNHYHRYFILPYFRICSPLIWIRVTTSQETSVSTSMTSLTLICSIRKNQLISLPLSLCFLSLSLPRPLSNSFRPPASWHVDSSYFTRQTSRTVAELEFDWFVDTKSKTSSRKRRQCFRLPEDSPRESHLLSLPSRVVTAGSSTLHYLTASSARDFIQTISRFDCHISLGNTGLP